MLKKVAFWWNIGTLLCSIALLFVSLAGKFNWDWTLSLGGILITDIFLNIVANKEN